ncbi:hypothetical protein bcere0022_34050 [Bacillus cereus Rock3-44]|nr:hypothetical protein bcere0022_34050 [Bacillus cereus Rock3-44]
MFFPPPCELLYPYYTYQKSKEKKIVVAEKMFYSKEIVRKENMV